MAFKKLFGRKPKLVSSVPSNNTDTTTTTTTGCFDCNICLDLVHDPVVTLCGHLFCWPCLYEWLNVQSTSVASDEHPQCPVCKAEVSQSTVVPLYGRGETPNPTGHNQGPKSPSIPARPPAYDTRALLGATSRPIQQLPFQNPYQGVGEQYYPAYDEGVSLPSSALFNQARNQSVNVVHPVLEMFAELIYTHISRNPSHDLYSLRNSHHRVMNPRLRWQEMRANKFLSRISLFFLCCILICLVLF